MRFAVRSFFGVKPERTRHCAMLQPCLRSRSAWDTCWRIESDHKWPAWRDPPHDLIAALSEHTISTRSRWRAGTAADALGLHLRWNRVQRSQHLVRHFWNPDHRHIGVAWPEAGDHDNGARLWAEAWRQETGLVAWLGWHIGRRTEHPARTGGGSWSTTENR